MKYLAIGNDEPCPFCGEVLDNRVKGKEIWPHLKKKHKKELLKTLFGKGE